MSRKKKRAEVRPPCLPRIDKAQVWLSQRDLDWLIDLLITTEESDSSLYKLFKDALNSITDDARRLQEIEARARASAFWDETCGDTKPVAPSVERIKAIIESRNGKRKKLAER